MEKSFESMDRRPMDDGGFPSCKLPQSLRLRGAKNTGTARASNGLDMHTNTHTIAYEEPNFVWKLTTVPDLLVICGMEAMLDKLK